ncbi:hypothetical protein [Streptomyces sp. NPDC002785]|uniref:hypothetical protein n=1 Tax=Streptomyces sp. NPDC002785 TaxID=3154543 RepID=UPI00333189E2
MDFPFAPRHGGPTHRSLEIAASGRHCDPCASDASAPAHVRLRLLASSEVADRVVFMDGGVPPR